MPIRNPQASQFRFIRRFKIQKIKSGPHLHGPQTQTPDGPSYHGIKTTRHSIGRPVRGDSYTHCVCVWMGGWVCGCVCARMRACVCVCVRVRGCVFSPDESDPWCRSLSARPWSLNCRVCVCVYACGGWFVDEWVWEHACGCSLKGWVGDRVCGGGRRGDGCPGEEV